MKPPLTLATGVAIAVLMGSTTALGVGTGRGIGGSAHDFSEQRQGPERGDRFARAWGGAPDEMCRVCHLPHDRSGLRREAPEIPWNRHAPPRASWSLYASDPETLAWIDAAGEPAPAGSSKLCLGCHDGLTALNQYDGGLRSQEGGGAYGRSRYGAGYAAASLEGGHPISVSYAFGEGSRLRNPALASMSNGDRVESLLNRGRVECSTCHDVHDTETVAGTALLREANSAGDGPRDICFLCHDM